MESKNENQPDELAPEWALQKGDRVKVEGGTATVVDLFEHNIVGVVYDGVYDQVGAGECVKLPNEARTLFDEVQPLINTLVSMGQDNPRVLSRQVAQLLAETKGRLSRGERLQAAAMLLVAAGLEETAHPDDEG